MSVGHSPRGQPSSLLQADIRNYSGDTSSMATGHKRGQSKSPDRTETPNKKKKSMCIEDLANILVPKMDQVSTDVTSLRKEVISIKNWMGKIDSRVTVLENTAESQASEIAVLRKENAHLLDEIRRSNLLFHGLPDRKEEKPEELKHAVQDLLSDTLEVSVKIDEVFRMGHKDKLLPGKSRPVKVKFPTLSDRSLVLNARKKLEGSTPKMYITEDLTLSTRLARQKAYEQKIRNNQTTTRNRDPA